MATMLEVAQHASVSVTTVSHVLNGTRFVSEDLVARVTQAVEELNYQPDSRARSLRRGRSETIAVIVSDIGNTFFPMIVRGIEDRLLESVYGILLCNTGEDSSNEERNIAMMHAQRVDGYIVAPTSDGDQTLQTIIDQASPLVVVDRPVALEVDQIYSDNEQGGYDATRHMIELGHRRIGTIVEISGIRSFDDRVSGWKRALNEAAIPIRDGDIRQAGLEVEGAAMAARALLSADDRVSAVFSSNNLMTMGILQYLKSASIDCPNGLSLVGFDDPPWARLFRPALTSVAQQPFEMGYKAAEMLVRRIEGDTSPPERICLDCELQVRESTAPYMAGEASE